MEHVYTDEDITRLLALDAQRSQGSVVPHVSGDDAMTDLEYRGASGKYTLASVSNDNEADPVYFAELFNNGVAIIRQLLAERGLYL